MPFVAKDPGTDDWVIPAQAKDSVEYTCTNCGGTMFVRPHKTVKSSIRRHFFHYDESGCVGEKDVHFHAKMMATSLLHEIFEDSDYTVDYEMLFKKDGLKDQFADAGVKFDTEEEPWGHGLAIEVQHKNESKNRRKTSYNYNKKNITVLWLKPHHLLQMGENAKNDFYKMIIGKHNSLIRNDDSGKAKTYPYIKFYDQDIELKKQKKHRRKSRHRNSALTNKSWSSKRMYTRVAKTPYKSLTPKTEPYHCEKHGCLNHFVKVYEYQKDGIELKMKRCEEHREPTSAEITTRFGSLRRKATVENDW